MPDYTARGIDDARVREAAARVVKHSEQAPRVGVGATVSSAERGNASETSAVLLATLR